MFTADSFHDCCNGWLRCLYPIFGEVVCKVYCLCCYVSLFDSILCRKTMVLDVLDLCVHAFEYKVSVATC